MTVKITSDSTCDLSPELIEKYDIAITPLSVHCGDKVGRDGVEVTPETIYDYVEASGQLPRTSAVNVFDYVREFRHWRQQGYSIVHFCISSDFSSSYQNACIAAADIGQVYVVDSRNLSTGQGLLVLKEKTGDYTTAEAFSGKTIAAQNASLQYNLVTSQLPADVKVKLITNLNDAIMMLVTGKVDAVAVDADNGALFAGNYDSIAMADFHFDYSSEGNVLAVTKGETELIEAINKILDEVNEKGLYKQWKDDATELAKSLGIDVN